MLMAVVMHYEEEESSIFIHSQYRKQFYRLLSRSENPVCGDPAPRRNRRLDLAGAPAEWQAAVVGDGDYP